MDALVGYLQKESEADSLKSELCGNNIIFLKHHIHGKQCATYDYSDAIARKDSRCFFDEALFIHRHCCICAHYNRANCWNAVPGAKIVCGSLGFGDKEPRWFEFGSPTFKAAKDFMPGHPEDWDWHVWVEDGSSRVYDIVPNLWHSMMAVHGKRIGIGSAEETVVVLGETKESLLSKGLEYIAAPAETQAVLLSVFRTIFGEYLEKLGSTPLPDNVRP